MVEFEAPAERVIDSLNALFLGDLDRGHASGLSDLNVRETLGVGDLCVNPLLAFFKGADPFCFEACQKFRMFLGDEQGLVKTVFDGL